MLISVGIDPGKKGAAVALIEAYGGLHTEIFTRMEDTRCLIEWLEMLPLDEVHHVYLEKAQAMPKNGAVSMFNYGTGFGTLIGVLTALQLSHTLVPPRAWTKIMHLGCTGDNPKAKSKQAFERIFQPGLFTAKNEGIIDAALLAEYGRRFVHKLSP